jgi:MerR family transcriptional regulator, copper efflux regulator
MQTLTIGKAAKAAGVGIDTVRFYEREGLLPEAQRTESGYRLYSSADVDRLRFIRRSKTLGFSLEEIAELMNLSAATRAPDRQHRQHDQRQRVVGGIAEEVHGIRQQGHRPGLQACAELHRKHHGIHHQRHP